MRRWHCFAVIFVLMLFGEAHGEDKTWTGAVNNVWNTTTANWVNFVNTSGPWNQNDSAILGKVGAGPINVQGLIDVASFNVTASDYVLDPFAGFPSLLRMSSPFNPTLPFTLPHGTIHVASAANTFRVNVNLQSSTPLLKTGGGTLQIGAQLGIFGAPGQNILQLGSSAPSPIGSAGTVELVPGGIIIPQPPPKLVVGAGWLNIGSVGAPVSEIVYLNSVQSGPFGPNTGNNGVYGSALLSILGPITVLPNAGGFSNALSANFNIGGSLQQFNIDAAISTPEYTALHVTGAIGGAGGMFKTSSYASDRTAGGIGLYGNNTYTGSTTIIGGKGGGFTTEPKGNVVAGTNASTSLEVYGGSLTLFGQHGSFGSASTVLIGNGGALSLDNVSQTDGTNAPLVPAANNNNRLKSDALVALQGGSLHLIGQANAPTSQDIGHLLTGPGYNLVSVTRTGSGTAVLNAASGWLQDFESRDVTQFIGTTLGASSQIKLAVNIPTHVGGLIPRAYGFNESSGELGFVKHDANGIMLLGPSEYVAGFGAGGNVSLILSPPEITVSQTVNSVRAPADIPLEVTMGSGVALTFQSGMILTVPPTTFGTQGVDNTITAGSVPLSFVTISETTVHSQITGTNGLIKAGEGTLSLHGALHGLLGDFVNLKGKTNLHRDYAQPIKHLGGEVGFHVDQSGQPVDVGDPTLPPDQDPEARKFKTSDTTHINVTKKFEMNSAARFDISAGATFSGEFTKNGTLEKRGLGKMDLNGPSPNFMGRLDVAEGALAINTAFRTLDARVRAGAKMQGVGSLTVDETLRVEPLGAMNGGNSPGTLTIAGNVVMMSSPLGGAILRAEGDSTQNSKIVVAGAAKTFNLEGLTGSNKFTIDIVGPSLTVGANYSWELVRTADNAAGLLVNGMVGTGGVIAPSNYVLTSSDFPAFTNVSLIANGNSLVLNFTPVPEPVWILTAAAGAAGIWRWRRWKWALESCDKSSI